MNKYVLISILSIILILPIASASNVISVQNSKPQKIVSNGTFTHTVFVESGTMTTCPYCVTAANQLFSIYNSGDLDFHYVALVWDEGNLKIRGRLTDLGVSSVPDVFFDGKFKHLVGAQSTETSYRNAITQAGSRDVPDIDIDVSVQWQGGGKLEITVTVNNNELEKYNGHLRTFVVEKVSRWNDNSGNPYHYAAIDIPIDKDLLTRTRSKPTADTYVFTKKWNGALMGFGDITIENTMVVAAVYDKTTDYAVETTVGEPVVYSSHSKIPRILQLNILEKLAGNYQPLEKLLNLI